MSENSAPVPIVDLTECYYRLVDHRSLNNCLIELDESRGSNDSVPETSIETIQIPDTPDRSVVEIPVTPQNHITAGPIRRSRRSRIVSPVPVPKQSPSGTTKFPLGECPICLGDRGRLPLASTICGHIFCSPCLERTLQGEKRCPICRTPLRGKKSYHPIYLGSV